MSDFRTAKIGSDEAKLGNPAEFAMKVFGLLGGEMRFSDDGKFVDLIFSTVEAASSFKTRYERDIGGKFQGMIIRWRGMEWFNKPECKVFQVDFLNRLQKWDMAKLSSERDNAISNCQCYNCGRKIKSGATVQE